MPNYLDNIDVIGSNGTTTNVLIQDRGTLALANQIANNLATEITNRTNADTALQTNINNVIADIAKNKVYVTPEEFGAVGDGVTSDYNAFVQAIATDKPIALKSGSTYLIDSSLSVEDLYIIGNSATIIVDGVYLLNSYDNLKFTNVNFNFNSTSQGLINPTSTEGESIVIDGCTFKNAHATSDPNESFLPYGACIYANAKEVKISNSYAENIGGHFVRTYSSVTHSTVHFINNTIHNTMVSAGTITSSYGIGSYQTPANASNYDLVVISGNHIDGMLGSGIACHSMDNAFISDNEVSECGEHSIVFMGGHYGEIYDNKCIEDVGCGIRVQSNNNAHDTSHVNVHDNFIKGNGILLGGGQVDDVKVHNNIIEGYGNAFYGIRFTGWYNSDGSGCYDVYVKDNVIRNITYPLYVERGSNKEFSATDNIIDNKKEYGASYGGFDWERVNAMDENNHFYDNSVPSTINGTASGNTYTASGNRFLEATATTSDLSMDNEYCGISFDYDANCPCACMIGYYISGGTLLGPIGAIPLTEIGDEATKSHYEFIFDIQSTFNQVKGAHNASEVLSVAIRIVKANGINTTTATIKNVTMFKGNRGLLK